MHTRWWDIWAEACRPMLPRFDLGWAVIESRKIAVVGWQVAGVPQIVLDRPLAEGLVEQDAGLALIPLVQTAARQFAGGATQVTVPLPRSWRTLRARQLQRSASA